ncbi:hypothetical protein [Streptomyces sp. NPDC058401]|uniref:hypothetical protein n=1 Tax=Streptomyces sp. NPDC058401 TaxID=3346480 RepID=UPI00364BE2F0
MAGVVGVVGLVGKVLAAARVAGEVGDWDAYGALLRRAGGGGVGALRAGMQLIRSAEVLERELGCDVLGEVSDREPAVRREAADALAVLAQGEREVGVLRALARAIGRTGDGRAGAVLVVLAGHADPSVRREVASSFGGLDMGRAEGPAALALIRLTGDGDPAVREWATFSLGFLSEADGPAVRAALWERTVDGHAGVREEGIRGLASPGGTTSGCCRY